MELSCSEFRYTFNTAHRPTSQGTGKTIILKAKAKFFRQKPAVKNEKKLYLLNEKTKFILSSEIKCPKSGIFTGWVESVKVILQVSIAVFFLLWSKNFLGKDVSAPYKRLARTAYAYDTAGTCDNLLLN